MPADEPQEESPPQAARLDITPKLLLENWRGELDATELYRALAKHERTEERASVLLKMADDEQRHADIMARRLGEEGVELPEYRVGVRIRFLVLLARIFGTGAVLPMVASIEAEDVDLYLEPEQDAAVQDLAGDERTHYRTLGQLARGSSDITRHERWHKTGGGGTLRATIFGVNDGLVSNFALVMGFAGAQADAEFVVLAGVAGLLAGASSMGAGEYVSVRAQRELFERQIELERTELALAPEEERDELALIYRAKGIPRADAERFADHILEDPDVALDTLVREELGLDPAQLGSPWGAAISSMIAFSLGAIVPVIAYFSGAGLLQFTISAALSGLALFGVGMGVSLFTGRNGFYSGARQLLIGATAAAITFGIGTVIGAATGI